MRAPIDLDASFTHSLAKLMTAAGKAPGFWSAEITPPTDPEHSHWRLIQRFNNWDNANQFKISEERQKLLAEIFAECKDESFILSEEVLESDSSQGMVETAIVTDIKPEAVQDYFDWECQIQTAQAKYQGYRGVYWQPPLPGGPLKWATVLRFDSPENLQRWFSSDERKRLIVEQEALIHGSKMRPINTSFPGWFPVDEETGAATPKWKTAFLLVLALFPIICLQLLYITPRLGFLNPALVIYFNLIVSVGLTTFLAMPALIKIFRWWLLPQKNAPSSVHLNGILLMLFLYFLEITTFFLLL